MLANPWVIRVGGGLICGIIVYLVASLLVAKKERKYYLLKLNSANHEIIQTIRPMIAKDDLFDINLFNSIISSTANKYNVDKADLYNIQSLIDDIITDIMQSAFLTMEQKDLYCKNLMDLKVKSSKKANDPEKQVIIREGISGEFMSLLVALMTIMFTIFSIYIFQLNDIEKALLFSNKFYFLLILIVLSLIPIFLIQIMDNIKKMRSRNKTTNTIKEKFEEKATDKKETESKEINTPEN